MFRGKIKRPYLDELGIDYSFFDKKNKSKGFSDEETYCLQEYMLAILYERVRRLFDASKDTIDWETQLITVRGRVFPLRQLFDRLLELIHLYFQMDNLYEYKYSDEKIDEDFAFAIEKINKGENIFKYENSQEIEEGKRELEKIIWSLWVDVSLYAWW